MVPEIGNEYGKRASGALLGGLTVDENVAVENLQSPKSSTDPNKLAVSD